MGKRLAGITELNIRPSRQQPSKVVVGPDVIALESNSFTVLGDGLCDLAFDFQGNAEVVVGLDEILLETDGLAELGDSLISESLVA